MQRPHDGVKVDQTALIEETLEQCVLADEVGFDYLWLVEHHFLATFSGSSAPEVMLSALSRMTKRVRLGFGVVVLPYYNPIHVAERVAAVDHLSGGRVEFGIGRGAAYEQVGMGVDPRDTRELMDESLRLITEIWRTDGKFSWEGKHFDVPPREILPKPHQDPHPPIWMACTQAASYEIAAKYGIGVLSFGSGAPAGMKKYVDAYHEEARNTTPVGDFVNNQWASYTMGHCGDNDTEARELGARVIKEYYAPGRPYSAAAKAVFESLLETWDEVPEDLKVKFQRNLGEEKDLGGAEVPRNLLGDLPADLLCERGVIVAGDPDTCIECVRRHEEIGADQMLSLMQTDQVPHEKVMRSLKLFGEEVIPAFR